MSKKQKALGIFSLVIIMIFLGLSIYHTLTRDYGCAALDLIIVILYEKIVDSVSDNNKQILIKYFPSYGNLDLVEKIDKGDWIDLKSTEYIELKKGDFALIPLGIAMQLPYGYEAHLAPRSSTFKNYGLIQTNSVGIIDRSYCGDNDEWKMPVYATRDTKIFAGDKICQFRIVKNQPNISFKIVDVLGNKDRNGFGSTGR